MHETFTTLVGVDPEHLEELKITWPTWMARPEIAFNPVLFVVDPPELWTEVVRHCRHPKTRGVCAMRGEFGSQREKMLTSLVFATEYIETDWYLKLDTDAVSTRKGEWIDPSWFENDPVFVSSPWGYTKPASWLKMLNKWGDNAPGLLQYQPVKFAIRGGVAKAPRIISWCFFGRTDWTQEILRFFPDHRLPVPSQDTSLWYIAARRGDPYKRVRMSQHGWGHFRSRALLRGHAHQCLNG